MKTLKIWIATGGTGGHVFPAIAVATELARRGHRVIISSDGRTMDMVRKNRPADTGIAFIWAGGVGAKSKLQQAWALFKIGMSAAALTLRFMLFRPAAIVSFGGYASVPAVLAAHIWKIPIFLHEQNAAIGRANAFALRWVGTLMTSFPAVAGVNSRQSKVDNKLKVVYTGLPVRTEFNMKTDCLPSTVCCRLLVTGGSLGATILDEIVPAAVAALPAAMKKKLFIVHQTRPDAVNRLRAQYEKMGVRANVLSFIHDMADQMRSADLVISRAGASTVVELQTLGKPAILVPLSINPDQPANAAAFVKNGGGFNIPQNKFTTKWLAATLSDLFSNPARLAKMADKARVPNDAVNKIVEVITKS
ncbi:MAG: UDP-N-acetylglucosamine--N-acetylmuramyl-(pentapeptide) pyrophosphoryl-undecaprenol N-acetylglucosamine transferase [Alphaproteobacteria bacterium]|nr:UDP-N-acetylglucosamine--N-acetylmuramyl-(pentapeptide) pyrophosphoryl-undecaprenol N-acetylglucosamine transferase [Alphaproteobacteria bacterium]MCL2889796.1 UDP-N-acetylglucosamine--N-acetylmuramyl-(pentapeptide) pyrophosphoryl-undecaprenol N-acetylglucosamine transferase [Alphaproteobacteria bacterium]